MTTTNIVAQKLNSGSDFQEFQANILMMQNEENANKIQTNR